MLLCGWLKGFVRVRVWAGCPVFGLSCFPSSLSFLLASGSSAETWCPPWRRRCPRAACIPAPVTTSKGRVPTCPKTWTTHWASPEKRCVLVMLLSLHFNTPHSVFLRVSLDPQVVSKEKEVLEWKRKYEDSRQEVMEMR